MPSPFLNSTKRQIIIALIFVAFNFNLLKNYDNNMPATALTASKLAPSTGANPDSSSIAATHHSFLAARYIYTCNSGCIDFSKKIPACIGGYRKSPSQGPWGEVLDTSSIANAVNLTGNVNIW